MLPGLRSLREVHTRGRWPLGAGVVGGPCNGGGRDEGLVSRPKPICVQTHM